MLSLLLGPLLLRGISERFPRRRLARDERGRVAWRRAHACFRREEQEYAVSAAPLLRVVRTRRLAGGHRDARWYTEAV